MPDERYIFLGHAEGFHATIKAQPEHFIVYEIPALGHNVRLHEMKRKSDEDLLLQSKRVKTDAEDCIRNEKNLPNAKLSQFQCDVVWCEERLKSVLSDEIYTRLKNFAETAMKNYCLAIADTIVLGKYPTRDERTQIHRCCRFKFPHLETITEPCTSVVSVKVCPNFRKFVDVVDEKTAQDIFKFILVETFENLKDQIYIAGDFCKEKRTKLHHLISSCFGKFIEAKTCPPTSQRTRKILIRRKRQKKDNSEVNYTAFTLCKTNMETQAAIRYLSSHLCMRTGAFSIAGNKDKRAVTSQTCTVAGLSPEELQEQCLSLPKFLQVSNAFAVPRSIHLGELTGNKFVIRLTNVRLLNDKCQSDDVMIKTAIEDVKKSGFVNYFGPQRFGRRVAHYQQSCSSDLCVPDLEAPSIGLAILMRDYKGAVEILLCPTDAISTTDSNEEKAREYFITSGDPQGTLEMMPQHKFREIQVLRSLRRFRNCYVKALHSLPHSSKLLYVHSFCSWVWNSIATARLEKYDHSPIPGDLVLVGGETTKDDDCKKKVHIVTEDDANTFSWNDVVLTIPGSNVIYPPVMEVEYRRMLGALKEDPKRFRISKLNLYAPGAYRKIIEYPRNLTFQFLPAYKLMKDEGALQVPKSEMPQPGTPPRLDDIELSFNLPPSCYATTFLQELSKTNLGSL